MSHLSFRGQRELSAGLHLQQMIKTTQPSVTVA